MPEDEVLEEEQNEVGTLLTVLSGYVCLAVVLHPNNLLLQIVQATGRIVPSVGKQVDASKKFHSSDKLIWSETISDGFYDPGSGRKFIPYDAYPDDVLTTEDLDKGIREIILIDSRVDPSLRRCVKLLQSTAEGLPNSKSRIVMIKKAIGMLFNGQQTDITNKSNEDIVGKPVKRLIGDIKHGVCRHYSLAAKYFCDLMGIPAWLQRGDHDGDRHAWVVASLSCKFFLIDMALSNTHHWPNDFEWPDRLYKPTAPLKHPRATTVYLETPTSDETISGYFPLPENMERVNRGPGGICIEIKAEKKVMDVARQQLMFPCDYAVRLIDVPESGAGGYLVENFATTIDIWIRERMGSVFDATKMVKVFGMVLVQLHLAGLHHGDVCPESVAAFISPIHPSDIRDMKVLFPTSSRRPDGSAEEDWNDLLTSLLKLAPNAKKIPEILKEAASGNTRPFLKWVNVSESRRTNTKSPFKRDPAPG